MYNRLQAFICTKQGLYPHQNGTVRFQNASAHIFPAEIFVCGHRSRHRAPQQRSHPQRHWRSTAMMHPYLSHSRLDKYDPAAYVCLRRQAIRYRPLGVAFGKILAHRRPPSPKQRSRTQGLNHTRVWPGYTIRALRHLIWPPGRGELHLA